MRLYILTHGRVDRQTTYNGLPDSWKRNTQFVVQQREAHLHEALGRDILTLPPHITNLHQTRQWLLDNVHTGKVVEMDDDIVFSARRDDEPTKFRPMQAIDFDYMFEELEGKLKEGYQMVGIVAREGANRNTEPYLYATRQMRLHAFNADLIKGANLRWDLLRSPGPEDFCMLLQLLTRGHENCVVNSYCQNQGGSNTSGGGE